MAMRREPNKVAMDSSNRAGERVVTTRRRSISCTRLAPYPQLDPEEMRKLCLKNNNEDAIPTINRVDSPDIDTSMNILGIQNAHRSTLQRKSAFAGSLRMSAKLKSQSGVKQGSWLNPASWLRKIKNKNNTSKTQLFNEVHNSKLTLVKTVHTPRTFDPHVGH